MTNQYTDWSPDFIGGYSQKRPQSASLSDLFSSLDPTTTRTTTPQFIDPSSASLPKNPISVLPFQEQANQVGQGVAGGVLDVFGRLVGPQTSHFMGKGNEPYSPMFNPESFWGQLGRGIVGGYSGGYQEGPLDHRSLSPVDQALMFLDIADPSGVGGDVVKAGAKTPLFESLVESGKVIPDTVAGIAGVMSKEARSKLKNTKVLDKSGNPERVYHGTKYEFDDYDPNFMSEASKYGQGAHFTNNPDLAARHAGYSRTNPMMGQHGLTAGMHREIERGGSIRFEYLNLEKPFDMNEKADPELIEKLVNQYINIKKIDPLTTARDISYREPTTGIFRLKREVQNQFRKSSRTSIMGKPSKFENLSQTQRDAMLESDFRLGSWGVPGNQLGIGDDPEELVKIVKDLIPTNEELWHLIDSLKYSEIGDAVFSKGLTRNELVELGYDGISWTEPASQWPQGIGKRNPEDDKVWLVFPNFDEDLDPISFADRIFPAVDLEGMPPQGTGGVLPIANIDPSYHSELGRGVYFSTNRKISEGYAEGLAPFAGNVSPRPRQGNEIVSEFHIPKNTKIFSRDEVLDESLFQELMQNPKFAQTWEFNWMRASSNRDNLWRAAEESRMLPELQKLLENKGYKGARHGQGPEDWDYAIWDSSIIKEGKGELNFFRGASPPQGTGGVLP